MALSAVLVTRHRAARTVEAMTTAHAYELPSGAQLVIPAADDDAVVAGQVVPLSRDGRPVAVVTPIDPDQWWFWTPEWQEGEREVDAELADPNRKSVAMTGEEFLASLDALIDELNCEEESTV